MNVLCLAPHPDDEVLGCGGTLRGHIMSGDDVTVVFFSDGEIGAHGADRIAEAHEAASILGIQHLEFLHEPDGAVRGDRIPQRLADLVNELRPTRIYAPHPNDDHVDHTAVANIAAHISPNRVLSYEIWTPISRPTHLVEISAHVNIKRGAIRCYKSQLHGSLDEAILALNHYRGLLLGPNNCYMEAFA